MNTQQTIRIYRERLVTAGQASPLKLGKAVAKLLKRKIKDSSITKPIRIVDVGFGLGKNMAYIIEKIPNSFNTIHGIDWSPATIDLHKKNTSSVYNEVRLCDSSKLPYNDNEFDIALSMENLEHLYGNGAVSSLNELKRIARHVIITTPLPSDVINLPWISKELAEAELDQIPLSSHDYICLESAVHKSTLFPKSMINAGFSLESNSHGIYFGISKQLKINDVAFVAIEQLIDKNYTSLKDKYLALLAKSAALHMQIIKHPLYDEPPITTKARIQKAIASIKNLIR